MGYLRLRSEVDATAEDVTMPAAEYRFDGLKLSEKKSISDLLLSKTLAANIATAPEVEWEGDMKVGVSGASFGIGFLGDGDVSNAVWNFFPGYLSPFD